MLRLEVLKCGEAGRAEVGGARASPERRQSPEERLRRRHNQLHEHDVAKSEPMGTHHCGCFHYLQLSFRRHVVPPFAGLPPPYTLLASSFLLPHPFFLFLFSLILQLSSSFLCHTNSINSYYIVLMF